MHIGFIGLGVMGRPMAGHLIAAGHDLHLHRIKDASRHLIEAGGTPEDSPAAVASASDVVILMVPETPDVEAVLFGEAGVEEGLSEGKLVIDMSSIAPGATRQFAKRIAGHGCGYLDAPVSGGEGGAKSAALTIMVGGSAEDVERAMPLFRIMGKSITHIGDVGTGQTAKIANQIVVGLNIEAVAEALTFARKAGADPARVRKAMLGGAAGSKVLEVHGERMIERTFDPGFRIRLHRKDISLAVEVARQLDMALPHAGSLEQMMNTSIGRGDGDRDHAALVRLIETLAGHDTA